MNSKSRTPRISVDVRIIRRWHHIIGGSYTVESYTVDEIGTIFQHQILERLVAVPKVESILIRSLAEFYSYNYNTVIRSKHIPNRFQPFGLTPSKVKTTATPLY